MAQRNITRRQFLALTSGLAVVGVAGCSQPAPAPTTAPAATKAAATTAPAATQAPAATAAPAATQAPAAAGTKKSLTAGFIAEQIQLDPHLLTAQTDQFTQHAVFNGLTAWDKEIKVQPDLAESWTNPDPKTWIFNLRQGVKFHNGREMVADDVKFSIDRIKQIGTKGKYGSYIVDVASVDVLGKYQVKLNLTATSGPLLDNLTYCSIMPPEASDGEKQSKQPIGAGPYKFVERVPNRYIKFVKNPDYWRKPQNYPDELTFVPAVEEQTALASIKSGQIDFLDQIALKYATELESSPDVKLIEPYPGSASYTWTLMKNTAKPFDDVNMRMAVSYAIDRAAILKAVYFGHGEASWNVFPSKHWAFDASIKGPELNLDQAKKYLAAAKYGGEEIVYDIFTTAEYPQMAQIIQANLKAAGMNIKIVQSEFAVWIQKVYQQHNFQIAQTAVVREWDADGLAISCLYTKGSNNPGEYSSKDMDAAFDRGRQTTILDDRKKAYSDVQKIYAQDQPHVKAVSRNIPGAYLPKKIKTINRSPSYMVYWRDVEMV
ncbi:MAG: ABC transporter substrate-binding protein [Chloroflexota bacterium]